MRSCGPSASAGADARSELRLRLPQLDARGKPLRASLGHPLLQLLVQRPVCSARAERQKGF
eukprot:370763-Rhodomonas_salina.1